MFGQTPNFVPLASRMEHAEAKFREPVNEKPNPKSPLLRKAELSFALDRLSLKQIKVIDSRNQQVKIVLKACNSTARYRDIL